MEELAKELQSHTIGRANQVRVRRANVRGVASHGVQTLWHVEIVLISRLVQLTYTVVNEMNEMSENEVSQKVKCVLSERCLDY